MSRYSQPAGQNSWSGGEAIEPLDQKEAIEWLERTFIGVPTQRDLSSTVGTRGSKLT